MRFHNKRYFTIFCMLITLQIIGCSGYSIYMVNFSTEEVDFDHVDIESYSDIDLTLKNRSGVDRDITELTITGDDASDFEIISPNPLPSLTNPLVSPKKDDVTITVRFNAENPIGERLAYLNIQYGDYLYTRTLKAYAEPIPKFDINETTHDFGNVSRQGDKPFDFEITNTGGKDLEITSLTITGTNVSEFAVSSPDPLPTTENPYIVPKDGGMKIVTANFRPIDPLGMKYAKLIIEHSAIGSPVEIPLQGNTVKNSTLKEGDDNPRIFDPKLPGAVEQEFSYILGEDGVESDVTITVTKGTDTFDTLFTGKLIGQATPFTIKWDGKDSNDRFVDPGSYNIHIEALAGNVAKLDIPIDVIRLGIKKIQALDNGSDNEYQMVYFMRGTATSFTQTPATGEFSMSKGGTILSDLDNNDGTPKDIPDPHTDLDSFPMNNNVIEENDFNLPICYIRGTTPKFDITLGESATSEISKTGKTCNYPVTGFDIRTICKSSGSVLAPTTDEDNQPGEKLSFTSNITLPDYMGEFTIEIDWTWQYRETGTSTWIDIPGQVTTKIVIYTILDVPYFPSTGTQYAPWVKTVDDVIRWCDAYVTGNVDTLDELYIAVDHGFFLDAGSNGTGDYCYDCNPGNGATHYVDWYTSALNLSGFYNLTNGKRINCTDCATLSCCFYNMVGATNVQRVRLGAMTLNAIEGIGWQQFTLNLWGTAHSFSYHHVCTTSTSMSYILDNCMNLDIDGNPYTLPGTRGWNDPRLWTGTSGYDYLSASNSVSRQLDGKHTAIQ